MKLKITYMPLCMPKAFMDNIQSIEDELVELCKIPEDFLKARNTITAYEVKMAICSDCGFQYGSINCLSCPYW